jgi:hypothetical protein
MSCGGKGMTRIVKIQINSAGAWRDVLRFDITAVDIIAVMDAAALLVSLTDQKMGVTSLRLATSDTHQKAITRWTAANGWVDA